LAGNIAYSKMTLNMPLSKADSNTLQPAISTTDEQPVAARRRPILQQIRQMFMVAVLAAASYLVVSHFLLQTVKVVGMSMSPTLRDSQMYLLNRWIYMVRHPNRAEVIVLRDPLDNGFSVKRVVALPGDTVVVTGGKVLINGRQLNEPYLRGRPTFATSNLKEQIFTCGKDQYFVLGDNRGNSIDGRMYGPIPKQNIMGMLMY